MCEEQEYYEITDPAEAVGLGLLGKKVGTYFNITKTWRSDLKLIGVFEDHTVSKFQIYPGIPVEKIRIPWPTVNDLKEGDVIELKGDSRIDGQIIKVRGSGDSHQRTLKILMANRTKISLHTGSSWIPLKSRLVNYVKNL